MAQGPVELEEVHRARVPTATAPEPVQEAEPARVAPRAGEAKRHRSVGVGEGLANLLEGADSA